MSGWDSGSAAARAFPVGGCGAASGGDGAEERRGAGGCRGRAPASGGCGWAPAGRERAAGGGSETRTYLLAIRPISAAAPGLGKGVGRRDRPGAAAAPGAGGEGSGRRGRGGRGRGGGDGRSGVRARRLRPALPPSPGEASPALRSRGGAAGPLLCPPAPPAPRHSRWPTPDSLLPARGPPRLPVARRSAAAPPPPALSASKWRLQ